MNWNRIRLHPKMGDFCTAALELLLILLQTLCWKELPSSPWMWASGWSNRRQVPEHLKDFAYEIPVLKKIKLTYPTSSSSLPTILFGQRGPLSRNAHCLCTKRLWIKCLCTKHLCWKHFRWKHLCTQNGTAQNDLAQDVSDSNVSVQDVSAQSTRRLRTWPSPHKMSTVKMSLHKTSLHKIHLWTKCLHWKIVCTQNVSAL